MPEIEGGMGDITESTDTCEKGPNWSPVGALIH